jgi:hypothetical protein
MFTLLNNRQLAKAVLRWRLSPIHNQTSLRRCALRRRWHITTGLYLSYRLSARLGQLPPNLLGMKVVIHNLLTSVFNCHFFDFYKGVYVSGVSLALGSLSHLCPKGAILIAGSRR